MRLHDQLDDLHAQVKQNKWYGYFALFNRLALAAGFIPSGYVKITGERFTNLSSLHPMGNYLEALYHTGYYYPFIGYMQIIAALLLLIPRTATLGAAIYFPIILNICVLSLSVGFDGSLVSSPLMVWANLYLLCWDYDKFRWILPWGPATPTPAAPQASHNRFPFAFFGGVLVVIFLTGWTVTHAYQKRTRNTLKACYADCDKKDRTQPCYDFCDCIHTQGKPFNPCSETLRKAKEKAAR